MSEQEISIFRDKIIAYPETEIVAIASGCAVLQSSTGMSIVAIPKREIDSATWDSIFRGSVVGFIGSRFIGDCERLEQLTLPSTIRTWEEYERDFYVDKFGHSHLEMVPTK